ncbi:ABC transporter substrate-binding protein [Methylobacterium oryzae]|uniref:ABC transporter substrate-binding protein n=1 Tax=Methylobacterium oryzae TaxID=334852 RepID=UPI001F21FAA2|nr:ABC transporter substrate-binding protein [Methylobacterium oryzae]UIN34882.1 ABC transporter substrate-binding protein [Methylobacterium oryzae]
MKRRQFLVSGLICLAYQDRAKAVQGETVHRLAVLHPSEPTGNLTVNSSNLVGNALKHLEKLGYVEGKNLEVGRYSALGSTEKLRELAAEVVLTKPTVILAISGKTVSHLSKLTRTIPIVGVMSDPVAYGLVTSVSHPGGNITGASVDPGIDIWAKRITLLKEAVPGMSKVFFVAPDSTWTTAVGLGVKAAAEKTGVELIGPPVENPHGGTEYTKAFSEVSKRSDAILVSSAAENRTQGKLIIKLAQDNRLPALYPYRTYVTDGGLMAHDLDIADIWTKAADQIAMIFKGENPGDIPIYQPRQYHLVINMEAAKNIGFQFQQNIIAMADEVID